MRFLKFILLLFKRGSLHHEPIDFEENRRKILHGISTGAEIKVIDIPKNKTLYTVKSNIAYLFHARKMNTMFFVSAEKQLIYVRLLKSASTSVLKEFIPLVDPRFTGINLTNDQIDALSFHYVKKKLSEVELPYQKFAVIRNPFQRIVSVYLDLFDPDALYFSYGSYWFGILKPGMSFHDFIDVISTVPDFLKGPHFSPQHYILSKGIGLYNVKWFRLEKDIDALKQFLLQYDITLPYLNKQKSTYDYGTFYNESTLSKVYFMYEKDVHTFDYLKEYQTLKKRISQSEYRS